MLRRKQLTLSRVVRNGVHSSQSPAPSVTKLPLSFPILGYNHTNRKENVITSMQSPSLSLRALPKQPAVSHMHRATAWLRVTPTMPWWAVTTSASPWGQQRVLLLKQQPLPALTIPHLLDRTSPAPGLTVVLKTRNCATSHQHHSKPSAGNTDSAVTLTSSSSWHQLEQRNSHSIPGRRPSHA